MFPKKPLLLIVHFFLTWPISSRVCLISLLFRAETLKVNLLSCQAGISIGVCGGGGARVYLPRIACQQPLGIILILSFKRCRGREGEEERKGCWRQGTNWLLISETISRASIINMCLSHLMEKSDLTESKLSLSVDAEVNHCVAHSRGA